MVQKATSSHLVLLLTATGNYQCFILTGFDVLKQGCSRTTVSKAQHWASSNSSVSSELSVLNQLSHLFIWLELVPPKKKEKKKLSLPTSSCSSVRKKSANIEKKNIYMYITPLLLLDLKWLCHKAAYMNTCCSDTHCYLDIRTGKSVEMTHASSHGKGSLLFPVTVKRSPLWIWSGVTVLHQTSCQLFVYSMNPQSPMCHKYTHTNTSLMTTTMYRSLVQHTGR